MYISRMSSPFLEKAFVIVIYVSVYQPARAPEPFNSRQYNTDSGGEELGATAVFCARTEFAKYFRAEQKQQVFHDVLRPRL